MTVVSAMKFNTHEGAIVTDEQASYGLRKAEISTKVHVFRPNDSVVAMAGGSGSADVLNEVVKRTARFLSNPGRKVEAGEEIARYLGHALAAVRGEFVDGYLQATYRLSELEFQHGFKIPPKGDPVRLNQDLLNQYFRLLQDEDGPLKHFLNNVFLVLTHDEEEVELFAAYSNFENPIHSSRPFYSVGSGQETADEILTEFYKDLGWDKRAEIEPLEGLSMLLYATDQASQHHIGVGGTPQLRAILGGQVIAPSERNSRLAAEIVRGQKKGYLPPEFSREALDTLVCKGGDFEAVEQEMWNQVQDKRAFDLFLRGYKR